MSETELGNVSSNKKGKALWNTGAKRSVVGQKAGRTGMIRSLDEFGFYSKCAGEPLKRCKQRVCAIKVISTAMWGRNYREQTEARSLVGRSWQHFRR